MTVTPSKRRRLQETVGELAKGSEADKNLAKRYAARLVLCKSAETIGSRDDVLTLDSSLLRTTIENLVAEQMQFLRHARDNLYCRVSSDLGKEAVSGPADDQSPMQNYIGSCATWKHSSCDDSDEDVDPNDAVDAEFDPHKVCGRDLLGSTLENLKLFEDCMLENLLSPLVGQLDLTADSVKTVHKKLETFIEMMLESSSAVEDLQAESIANWVSSARAVIFMIDTKT